MPNVSLCPSPNDLRRFALGDVHEAEAQTLEQHLDTCSRCLETLEDQGGGDTLVESLRGPGAAQAAVPDDLVEDMVQRIGTLRHNAAAPSQQTDAFNTPAVDRGIDTPTTGAEQATGDTSAAEDFDFLAPAEQLGELGRLGGYRILQILGSGGMGVVFVAEDPQLQRRVALKVMRPSLAASKAARQRFLREARLAAKIEHDHLVHIYQVGEDRGMPFLAMQLLKGESLEERLRREETGVRDQGSGVRGQESGILDTLRIGREIAEGLAAAHAQGLIHRDIKPANVFLAQASAQAKAHGQPSVGFGRVKILDFGLARAVEDDAHITGSGVIAGTPAYMAPEQARAEAVDARTDLFSLGCVLYRMLVGRTPFRGPSTTAVLMSLANDEPAAPAEAYPETPKELSDLVMRLLAKNPAERPTSARELVEALTAIERQLQDDKVISRQADKVTSNDTLAVAMSPPHPVTPHSVIRSRRWLIAAAVVLFLGPLSYFFGGTIIRIATNQGELVIEADDANIEVVVKADGVEIIDKTAQRRFNLKAGKEHEIEVYERPDGVKLFTKRFTLTRGGREIVNVHQEIARLGKKPEAADPDRRVAEWVLSRRGNRYVSTVEGGVVRDIKMLPKEAFTLYMIVIDDKSFNDDDLEQLRHLTTLTRLHLDEASISDKGLARIADLPGLQKLSELAVRGANITDKGLQHIKRFKGVASLILACPNVTDIGLQHISSLPLTQLSLHSTRVTSEGIRMLQNLDLINLTIVGHAANDASLLHLRQMKTLQGVSLHGGFSDTGLSSLKELANLEGLTIVSQHITDAAVDTIQGLKKLTNVNVRGTMLTSAGVKKLAAALPKCTIESDHGTFGPAADADRRVAEWVIEVGGYLILGNEDKQIHVKSRDGLRQTPLSIFHVGFDGKAMLAKNLGREALDQLRGLSRVQELNLQFLPVNDTDLEWLSEITGLRTLNIGFSQVSDAGMAHVAGIKSLRALYVEKTKVGDAGLAHIADLTHLEELGIGRTKVTQAGLKNLTALRRLRRLQLTSLHVGDAGLRGLKELSALERLVLDGGTQVTDAGLIHLKDLPNLSELGLRTIEITDAGVVHLKELTKLRTISLKNTKVSADGVKKLAAALPKCRIESDHGTFGPTSPLVAASRSAPNLNTAKILFQEDFADRKSDWKPTRGYYWENGYAKDCYFMRVHAKGERANWFPIDAQGDFACEVVGRITGHPEGAWGIDIQNRNTKRYLAVLLNGQQELRIVSAGPGAGGPKTVGRVQHAAIKVGEAFNTLLVVFRGQRIEIFVNGVAVGEPLTTDHVQLPAALAFLTFAAQSKDVRGEFQRVKVWSAAGLAVDPDRRAAEWVLSVGGTVAVSVGGVAVNEGNHLKAATELPREPFRLTAVVLQENKKVTDAALAPFKDCKNLTACNLYHTQVSDAGIRHLEGLGNLRELNLQQTTVTAEGVKKLAAALPKCKIESDHGTFGPSSDGGVLRKHVILAQDEDPFFTAAGFEFTAQGTEIPLRCSPTCGQHRDLAVDVRFLEKDVVFPGYGQTWCSARSQSVRIEVAHSGH